MIYRLTIKCVSGYYFKEPFERVLEVLDNITLGELHDQIQKLTGFDNDHPFIFYASRAHSSSNRIAMVESEDCDELLSKVYNIPLHQVFPLPKSLKLFYWFDFGDNWKFQITRRIIAATNKEGGNYPRLIREIGPKPQQYPSFED